MTELSGLVCKSKILLTENCKNDSNLRSIIILALQIKSLMTFIELLPAIKRLSVSEKIKLIGLLAKDIELHTEIAPLQPLKTYDLATPYSTFGAGAILMQAMEHKNQD